MKAQIMTQHSGVLAAPDEEPKLKREFPKWAITCLSVAFVILAWEELSAADQGQTSWNQICQMVGFGSKKTRDLRERRRHDIESTGWRIVAGTNTGKQGSGYTLERISRVPILTGE